MRSPLRAAVLACAFALGAWAADDLPVLRLGNGADPQSLDPHITNGIPEFRIQSALFEGLLALGADGASVVPAAAERWEVSDDGLVWTFHLRADGRWSNGDPVTAHDFAWSWNRARLPGLACPYDYLYRLFQDDVPGAPAFEAVDARTFRVRLRRPAPHLGGLLGINAFFPVHRATVEAAGPPDSRTAGWDRPGRLVGNGAYRLETWTPNLVIEVRPNPHHRDFPRRRNGGVRYVPVERAEVEERQFAGGQLDVTTSVPPARIAWYRANRPAALRIDPYLGTYFLLLNTRRPPLDDVRVRRALALAIDRTGIVDHVTRGGQTPAYGFVPPGAGGYPVVERFEEDEATARTLLAEAGFPGGAGFPRLDFVFNTQETHRAIAETLQERWRTVLGIDITLANQEWKVFLANRRSGNYQVARSGWIGIQPDPGAFLELFLTGGGNNDTGWSDPAYDALLDQAAQTAEPARRHALFAEAETRLLEAMPMIPLYFYTLPFLIAPEVGNWHPHPLDRRRIQDVFLRAPGLAP